MNIPRSVFRQYDVRGIVGEELTPSLAEGLGRALVTLAWDRLGRAPILAVGRDNRPSGPSLAEGVVAGIQAAGGTAVDVGEVPTPALYFAAHAPGIDGGVQVTGSHNPPEYNGFKMVLGEKSLYGDAIQHLYETMGGELWRDGAGSATADSAVLSRYQQAIVSRHRLRRPVRVVVDCGNGVASLIAVPLLQAIGADVIPLFCDSDGSFPNHHPDPTVLENLEDLQREVRRSGAELGIAFDGDGDRIGAVDETGEVVFGDQLLVLYGRDLVRRQGPGQPVIFDVKCSEVLVQALKAAGAVPEMWKTGHSLIKARMSELGSPLAGEMSGHMFFGGDWYGFDDALFAAARLLEIVSAGEGGLAPLLADLPKTVATPELRVDCPEERKFGIIERAAAHFAARYPINTLDGVRITFPDGWGLIRASNTQPVLVMRFEAASRESLAAHEAEVRGWLGPEL